MKKITKKKITPSQYAEIRGISLQAVTKALRDNNHLPGVMDVEKFGRFYLLTTKQHPDGTLVM